MVCASIHTGFHLSRATRGSSWLRSGFVYGAFTLFGSGFHRIHLPFLLPYRGPHHQEQAPGFGLFRFRSPLLTESHSLSFPPLTEMFHFSGYRSIRPMNSTGSNWVWPSWVSPFGNLRVIKIVSISPKLIAGSHVLHRLLTPRHSPRALSSLSNVFYSITIKCINGASKVA